MSNKKNEDAWKEAKQRCRLNEADIKMAKDLGMTPKSLIKNIPSHDQKWKAPVKVWVSDLYEEKFGKVLKPASNKRSTKKSNNSLINEDRNDLPF